MITKHPNAEMLAEYSSGALSTALAVSVTTHLQFCDECRDATASLVEIGSEMLLAAEGVPVSDDLLDRVLACIDEEEVVVDERPAPVRTSSLSELPEYVQQLLPAESLNWRFLSPSLKAAAIKVGEDRHELALHRIKAGGRAPEHCHSGSEITVVLKGSFSDEEGVYHPGDFVVREAGEVHRPHATRNNECICLSVLEAPIELTGIKRVLNPFLSFTPG